MNRLYTHPCYTGIMNQPSSLATFGSGCFWCAEAMFNDLRGVLKVTAGYAGGQSPNPTYAEVCDGQTGHVEVIQVKFNPQIITYQQLLEVFFLTHDPRQLNRQGHDVGEQYRSVIFYHDELQQQTAQAAKNRIAAEKINDAPLVTAIEPLVKFYPAEPAQQNYYLNNPDQPYCQLVINPKLAKFRQKFAPLRKV